jgi:hypothetical protein
MKTLKIKKEFIISAPPEEIHPLLCPVREYDWIEGWKCQLVHCPRGRNEEGVIFYEKMSTPFLLGSMRGKTKWITILFDTTESRVHFKWINKYADAIYKMELQPMNKLSSKLVLDLTYNIKNKKGLNKLDNNFEYKLSFMIEGLGNMLKYYCENGKMLSTKKSDRKKEFVKDLSFNEKLTFLFGKLNMSLSRDRSRKKYKSGRNISVIGK